MVTIGMNYVVVPGKEATFERAFQNVLETMRLDPGHTNSILYRDVHNPQSYLILSEWSDEKAFRDFTRSEGFKRVVDWGKENILATRPKHHIYSSAALH